MSDAIALIALCLRSECGSCGAEAGKTCSGTIYLERGGNIHRERAASAAFLPKETFLAYNLKWVYDRIRDPTYVNVAHAKADIIVAYMTEEYRRTRAREQT